MGDIQKYIVLLILLICCSSLVYAQETEISDLMHGLAGLHGSGLGLPGELAEIGKGLGNSDIEGANAIARDQCLRNAVALSHNIILDKYASKAMVDGIQNWAEAFNQPLDKLKGAYDKVAKAAGSKTFKEFAESEFVEDTMEDMMDDFADYLEKKLTEGDDVTENYYPGFFFGNNELYDCGAEMKIEWKKSEMKLIVTVTGDCKCMYRDLKDFKVVITRDIEVKPVKIKGTYIMDQYYLEAVTSKIEAEANCGCGKTVTPKKPGFFDRVGMAWDRIFGGDETDEPEDDGDDTIYRQPTPPPKQEPKTGPTLWDHFSFWEKIKITFSGGAKEAKETPYVDVEEAEPVETVVVDEPVIELVPSETIPQAIAEQDVKDVMAEEVQGAEPITVVEAEPVEVKPVIVDPVEAEPEKKPDTKPIPEVKIEEEEEEQEPEPEPEEEHEEEQEEEEEPEPEPEPVSSCDVNAFNSCMMSTDINDCFAGCSLIEIPCQAGDPVGANCYDLEPTCMNNCMEQAENTCFAQTGCTSSDITYYSTE